jgi:hypothetical protein
MLKIAPPGSGFFPANSAPSGQSERDALVVRGYLSEEERDSGTPAQYDRLALLYVIASVRSQHWLIPAYHAALDADIPNGRDNPLNFDPESFVESIEAVVKKLQPSDEVRAANRQ